jgi:HEAT repeat protein
MQRNKSTPQDKILMLDETANPAERASAIMRLAADKIYDIELDLVHLLNHPSPFIREEAIKVLIGLWGKMDYLGNAVNLLHSDPDWSVRSTAAFSLSQYVRLYNNKIQELIIRELAQQLYKDEDTSVQKICYEEILQILAQERGWTSKKWTSLPDYFDRDRDVDWEIIKPYLNK